jgi:hypothetical protein
MKILKNIVVFDQEEAYQKVKELLVPALSAILSDYLDGAEGRSFFENVYFLKNNFEEIDNHFRDICASQVFLETEAEAIIITSSERNSVIKREPHEAEIKKLKKQIEQAENIVERIIGPK